MPKKPTPNFWSKLKQPIMCLAPMSDVTDSVFRQIIAKYGKPDVFFTEFVSVAGLCSVGRNNILEDLRFTKKEKPIVAQIWGSRPEQFYKSAKLVKKLGFDGIDINMGCPDKAVEKQGGGAALIKNPKLALEIIKETKRGAGILPVSVKTRLGHNTNIVGDWTRELLKTELAALIVHARTRKQMSKVPADWLSITKAVKIRNQMKSTMLIIGNGDVGSLDEARQRVKETNADGVMIGRGIFGNPWFFDPNIDIVDISIEKRLTVLIEHAKLFEKTYHKSKSFDIMKKHFKAYASGFSGAKDLRIALMNTGNAQEAKKEIQDFLKTLSSTNKQLK
ncbi:tRNA-dihydrouridine synthase [Patescibacteria group bacterium]|nr:tRNA-dihydrouridine synthase [Patescibacteria group bacterium]MBU1890583.1 tRNA-dihydrouridine synthase [Patescibacteria group bacterium]